MKIETRTFETPIGAMALAWSGETVLGLEMGWAKSRTAWESDDVPGMPLARLTERLAVRFPGAEIAPGRDAAVPHALELYFAGDVAAIDALRVDPGGTDFHARVWKELRRIPAGRTRTYAEVAVAAGSDSARATGGAVGSNPIPIVIPCHRVVGTSGRLTGFGGGLARKRWLLAHEGATFVDESPVQLSLLRTSR
jgi:methylated-DNA-[protein]-cysteine S-methyltransferase